MLLATTFGPMIRLLSQLQEYRRKGHKGLAVLLDPDKLTMAEIPARMEAIKEGKADWLMVGGSLITQDGFSEKLKIIRGLASCPVILFPGSVGQVSEHADGLLFLSLISGRNADLLIGQHVIAAPLLKQSKLEIIPTGYMLIDGGRPTTASYISHTLPIPRNKPEIAAATSMAGEMLGLRCIYLDTGSGADHPVPPAMIHAVRSAIDIPLITGGGIRSRNDAAKAYEAGADMIVVGTAFEEDPEFIFELPGRTQLY